MSKNGAKIGDYILGKKLGQGSVGKVKEGINEITGQKVAVKIINKRLVDSNRDRGLDKRIHREINIMKSLDHANVIKLYTVSEDAENWYIVMELVTGGELFDYIVAHGYLKENVAKRIFIQILAGVAYCHTMNVIHRDLKPENILLTTNRDVKITDFGLSNFFAKNELLKTYCGSPTYTAPELLEGRPYEGPSADIWSMGVILYAMLCGCPPYANSNVTLLSREIRTTVPEIPDTLSKEAGSLILDMLVVDPNRRMSVEQIISHPWLVSVKGYILHHNAPKKPDAGQGQASPMSTSPTQKKTPRARSVSTEGPKTTATTAKPLNFDIKVEKPTTSVTPTAITTTTTAIETKTSETTSKSESTPKSDATPKSDHSDESKAPKRKSITDKTIPESKTDTRNGSTSNNKSTNGSLHPTTKDPGVIDKILRISGIGFKSKELRILRTQFDTKTISNKPPEQIARDVELFLTSRGIEYKHKQDYFAIFFCTHKYIPTQKPKKNGQMEHKATDPAPKESIIKFQIEICKVHELEVHCLHFHRLKGNIWGYKEIVDKLTMGISPILAPPENGTVTDAAAAVKARDDTDIIDWWDFLNSAPDDKKSDKRKRSLPEPNGVPKNGDADGESSLVAWREMLGTG